MLVPGRGMVDKKTVCAWFSSGMENLSHDRGTRAAQPTRGVQENGFFNVREDAWQVGIGQDVAVLFEDTVWVGRIYRVRRRYQNNRWADYIYPVDLQAEKQQNSKLFFDMAWYSRHRTTPNVYVFGGHADTKEVTLYSVICPVTLSCDPITNEYSIPADQQAVLDVVVSGEVELI